MGADCVVVRRARVPAAHTGWGCRSGRLVRVRLTGRFPHLGVDRERLGVPKGPITSVGIVLDAHSGRTCEFSVGVGKAAAYRHAADLLPALRAP